MARLEYGKILCYVTPNIKLLNNEIFINVTEYAVPGVYNCYKVSNLGRVYDCIKNRFLTYHKAFNNYIGVSLNTINHNTAIPVHRLMMLCFYPINNPENYQVNHKDGIKTNNILSNLEWVTRSENIYHAYKTGLHHIGEDNIHSTISNDTAVKICELLQSGTYTEQQIADILNISTYIVHGIKSGRTWKHISKDYVFNKRLGRLYTPEMIHNICKYFASHNIGNKNINEHCKDALIYNNYPYDSKYIDSARKIYTRKYYTEISNNYNF